MSNNKISFKKVCFFNNQTERNLWVASNQCLYKSKPKTYIEFRALRTHKVYHTYFSTCNASSSLGKSTSLVLSIGKVEEIAQSTAVF